jgi:hypothetical protein
MMIYPEWDLLTGSSKARFRKGMEMIYYTGDIHGFPFDVERFCKRVHLTAEDILVILGDVGANYYGGKRDKRFKSALNQLGTTIGWLRAKR